MVDVFSFLLFDSWSFFYGFSIDHRLQSTLLPNLRPSFDGCLYFCFRRSDMSAAFLLFGVIASMSMYLVEPKSVCASVSVSVERKMRDLSKRGGVLWPTFSSVGSDSSRLHLLSFLFFLKVCLILFTSYISQILRRLNSLNIKYYYKHLNKYQILY